MVTIDITPYCGASRNWNTEILACKIAQNSNEKIILDLKHEGWDIVENGIEQKVKIICDELKIPYTQIEFRSCDRLCKAKTFKHKNTNELLNFFARFFQQDIQIVLPNKFQYGLFCGRASNERLYAFYHHKNWKYSNKGKASMHLDVNDVPEVTSDYAEFIIEYNKKWKELCKILPYSDVSHYMKPPLRRQSEDKNLWNNIYKDIAIEIVCETNTTPDTFFMTEKIIRPIAYGKLFLVIGSPNFELNLKHIGFDIFDDIIDKNYDKESSYMRVDNVFQSLEKFLSNPIDIEALLPRLEANKKVLNKLPVTMAGNKIAKLLGLDNE